MDTFLPVFIDPLLDFHIVLKHHVRLVPPSMDHLDQLLAKIVDLVEALALANGVVLVLALVQVLVDCLIATIHCVDVG